MGRYRAKRIIVKELPELTLVFWSQSAIYAQPRGSRQLYLFHNYYAPLGAYTNSWRPFKRRLLKSRTMTFGKCCQLAARYQVLSKGAVGALDWRKKMVEIRFDKWSIKGEAQ